MWEKVYSKKCVVHPEWLIIWFVRCLSRCWKLWDYTVTFIMAKISLICLLVFFQLFLLHYLLTTLLFFSGIIDYLFWRYKLRIRLHRFSICFYNHLPSEKGNLSWLPLFWSCLPSGNLKILSCIELSRFHGLFWIIF